MDDEVSYIANDARCLSGIEDLEAGMDILNWLGQYLELYINVTNALGKTQEWLIVITRMYIKSTSWSLHFVYMQKQDEIENTFLD